MFFTIIIILPFWKNDLTPPPIKTHREDTHPLREESCMEKILHSVQKVALTASPSGWKIVLTLLEKRFNPSGKVNVTVYSIRNFRP